MLYQDRYFLFGNLILSSTLLASFALAQAPAAPPPPVTSPEQHADHSVTFRVRAPDATKVQFGSSDMPQVPFGQSLDMTKGTDGVWEITVGPIDPGAYRYNFLVDGIFVLDPVSPQISESNGNAWSFLHIDGTAWMDSNLVDHGSVADVSYYSSVLKRDRRMHVYTPPGFANSDEKLPVFYLLHGALDSDDSWSTVGRAGFILDNLIAKGEANPMIVVMPHGHTGPFVMGQDGLPLEEFVNEFNTDIKPYIESHYPVLTDRANTAIAGLSMGGAQTLEIAFGDLAEYSRVGVYSSGVFGITDSNAWETQHQAALDNAALKEGLDLVWFGIGSEDFLLETSKGTVAMLEKHGFDVTYVETGGGHTWINWREYLHTFAPQLFR